MKFRGLLLAAAAVLTLTACDDSNSPTNPTSRSRLTVMLRDTPFEDAKAVLVTFTQVSAHQTGGAFTQIPFADAAPSRTCDLKKLTDTTDVLAVGNLPAGHYTMLRLVISRGALYFDRVSSDPPCASSIEPPSGRSAELVIPSGEIRLNREFEIPADDGTSIVLDFDGDRSIRETGSGVFRMTPVIGIVSVQ